MVYYHCYHKNKNGLSCAVSADPAERGREREAPSAGGRRAHRCPPAALRARRGQSPASRAGALQLRVRVQATFACACGRAPASRAGAGDLRVRLRACSRFAYACSTCSLHARAAFTHVRVTFRYNQPSRGRNGCRSAYLKTDLHTTHPQRKHDHGAHDHEQGIQPNWS